MCLCLHTPNVLKTRKKPTTDFVFDFLRNMEGQKRQISSWQKVCQCGALPQISLCWDILPQISQIYTEPSAEIISHRIRGIHRTFCWDNFPQNSQNPQNLLLRYSPTEFTEPTEPSAEKNSRRFHRFTQILLVRRFCVFCEFCGRITQAVSV